MTSRGMTLFLEKKHFWLYKSAEVCYVTSCAPFSKLVRPKNMCISRLVGKGFLGFLVVAR